MTRCTRQWWFVLVGAAKHASEGQLLSGQLHLAFGVPLKGSKATQSTIKTWLLPKRFCRAFDSCEVFHFSPQIFFLILSGAAQRRRRHGREMSREKAARVIKISPMASACQEWHGKEIRSICERCILIYEQSLNSYIQWDIGPLLPKYTVCTVVPASC